MKKVILFVVITTLLLSTCLSVSASGNETGYVYNFGNVTIIFSEDTIFSEEERVEIAQYLAESDNESSIQPCGLACLFGHNYEVFETADALHGYYDTQPKCLRLTYSVKQCTRCGKQEKTLIREERIECCP